MKALHHKNLSADKWSRLNISRQILNIASELSRAANLTGVSDEDVRISIERALELVDLSIEDRGKWSGNRLRELLRFRGALAECYLSDHRRADELRRIIRVLLSFDAESSTVELPGL
jgi:hypothetical protein